MRLARSRLTVGKHSAFKSPHDITVCYNKVAISILFQYVNPIYISKMAIHKNKNSRNHRLDRLLKNLLLRTKPRKHIIEMITMLHRLAPLPLDDLHGPIGRLGRYDG